MSRHKFVSYDYWGLCSSVLNKGESSNSLLFNQFGLLLFSIDKAECFDFPPISESLLCENHIIPFMLSAIISKFDTPQSM